MTRNFHSVAILLLILFSSKSFAACETGNGRLRGDYQINLQGPEGVLLRVRQPEEEVMIRVSGDAGSFDVLHPGGLGIDHYFVLENNGLPGAIQVCLFALYDYSEPGEFAVEEISLASFSPSQMRVLRELTEAAVLWAEDTPAARKQALQIYSEITSATAGFSIDFRTMAMLFEGFALARETDFKGALERLESLSVITPDSATVRYKLAWKKGEINLRINQPDAAFPELERAIAIVETQLQGDHGQAKRDLAEIRLLLAEAHLAKGDVVLASQQIELAAVIAGNNYRLLGKVYNQLGYQHIVSSRNNQLTQPEQRQFLTESINVMLSGRYFAESSADKVTFAAIENNLGFVYDRLGEYRRALIHYRQILDVIDPEQDPLVYRFAFANLGRAYQYSADYPRSESYYRQAILLAENSTGIISTSRCPLGTTLRLSGKLQEALAEHELCLQQAELASNRSALVLARYELAEDHFAMGDLQSAWQHIQWAHEQSEENISVALRTRILRRYAHLLQLRGQAQDANIAMSQALALHSHQLVPVDEVENYAMAMEVAMLQGNVDQAESSGLQAIALIEAQYEQLELERQGPAWTARTHEIYVQLAEVYLHTYFVMGAEDALYKAFNLTERSRAISLRQQFANSTEDAHENGSVNSPYSDSVREAAEQAQIAIISRIANEHAASATGSSPAISLPANYYHHQDVLSLYRLQGLSRLPLPPAMAATDIQSLLQPEQAVVYYLMAKENNYVFTVTADSLSVSRLDDAEATEQLIEASRSALNNPNASPYMTLSQLSEKLLGQIDGLDNKTELIIVPHGTLHALPFSALPMPGKTTYEPLISRFSLQTVPSMTAYLMDKPVNVSSGATDIAIFADPVFDASQLQQQLAVLAQTDTTTLRDWSGNLQRLPNTAIEAQNLAQLFTDERTMLFTGQRASRNNLAREDVRNAKVLHIATHGYFNSANDDNVGLGFSVID
ncbi:MAG: CHAT domain-containing protein [Gammaproteobacteria bacterium]|nr:CHAT domain-containing protein [Gammaproteobacteria bacterium]